MRTALVCTLLLACVAVGCDSRQPERRPHPAPVYLVAEDACRGLFVGEGARALERLLASNRFVLREAEAGAGAQDVSRVMESAYRSGPAISDSPQPECRVSGQVKGSGIEARQPSASLMFTGFSRHADPDGYLMEPGPVPHMWDSGTSLNFDCVSGRLGSTEKVPLRVAVSLSDHASTRLGRAGTEAVAADYRAILHSAATAVSRGLGCEGGAGLPEGPEGLLAFEREERESRDATERSPRPESGGPSRRP